MINIFHHSRAFIEKHKKHHHIALATLALILAGTGAYTYRHEIASAATFYWVQTSWSVATPTTSGGCTAIPGIWDTASSTCSASHSSNRASWPTYSSASGVTAGATVALPSSTKTVIDDGFLSTYSVGAGPQSSAYDSSTNSIWVANRTANTVTKLNASTGALIGTYGTGGSGPYGVGFDSSTNSIWVANITSNNVTKLNASTGAVIGTYAVGTSPVTAVYDSYTNSIWVVNLGNNVTKLNASTGAVTGTYTTVVNGSPVNAAFDSSTNSIWVVNNNTNNVTKLNASTGAVIGTYAAGTGPSGIAFDSYTNSIWVSSSGLYKINSSTGSGTNYGLANYASLAFDPYTNSIWGINCSAGNVYKVNVSTGALVSTYATGCTQNVTVDPANHAVWVTTNTNSITKLNINNSFDVGTNSGTMLLGTGTSTSVVVGIGALSTKTDYTTGTAPYGVAISAAGTSVYVTNHTSNTVSMFTRNTSTGTLSAKTDYPTGTAPYGVAISADGTSVYVANSTSNTVSMFTRNTSTGTLSAKTDYPTGTAPAEVTISADGTSVYVANYSAATVSMFTRNTSTGTLSAKTDYATGAGPFGVTISVDGASVYTVNNSAATVSMFTRNTSTGTLSAKTDYPTGTAPYGVAISADGTSVYATNYSAATVSMFTRNTSTGTLSAKTDYTTGANPFGVAISADGASVYVANYVANTISRFTRNTSTGTLSAKTDYTTGTAPYGVAISADGASVYVANNTATTVSMFTRSSSLTGTFTSPVINLGGKSATAPTFSWTAGGTGTVTMQVRAGDTATAPAWGTINSAWGAAITVSSGGSLSSLGSHQYLQYQATLTTADISVTPTLDSVTIGYTQYALSGNLTSSIYDSGSTGNILSKLEWNASPTDASSTVRFQVRTASTTALLAVAPWCGPALSNGCSGTNYFTSTGEPIYNTTLTDHINDEFIQYKVFITSGGDITPVLSSVTTTYAVNAAPDFDSTYGGGTGVTVSQDSTGNVVISYRVRDRDTSSGTNSPNHFTPSFEYSIDGGAHWAAISAGFPAGDIASQAVSGCADTTACGAQEGFATYTATWTPTAVAGATNVSVTNAKIRVTVNDNEIASNTAVATSGNYPLDTAAPTATITLDSSGGTDFVNLNVSDGTVTGLQFRLCDDVALTTCDAWANITSGAATQFSRTLTRVGGNDQVTLQARDAYGNTYTITAVGPANPASFDFKDVSNIATGNYREFLSWSVFVATTSSQFRAGHSPASYQVWHKIDTDPAYTLLTTITDPAINYYRHDIDISTASSTHFYKVVTVDEDGDISDPTTILSDIPNGQGGSDTTAPVIVGSITVPSATLKNTSAVVTWTTDEISKGTVQYSKDGLNSWTTVASLSYVIDHSIYLPNLSASQTYNIRVKSEDPTGNGVSDPYTNGPNFTTAGGPSITEINEKDKTDNSITIEWKTSTSSDSYVYYATDPTLLSGSIPSFSANQATCAPAGVCQHQIHLSNLSPGTTYYYSVKSTDADLNTSTADRYDVAPNSPLSFTTTHDVTAPVISTSTTPVLSSTAAVIVWTTDEPADSQVIWGPSDINLNHTSEVDHTMTLVHVKTLSADVNDIDGNPIILTPTTPYYYRVKSIDPALNPTTFPAVGDAPATFTTLTTGTVYVSNPPGTAPLPGDGKLDTTPPTLSDVAVSDITPFGATVKFGTSEDTVGFVKYGKDTSYGDSAGDDAWGTTHTIKFHGLTLGTPYHVMVAAIDKAGNTGTAADQTFTTKFLTDTLNATTVDNIEQYQKEIEAAIESVLPSLVPPFVSKPTVTNITESGANVNFKTNIKAFPVVVYADDGSYDSTKDNPYTGEVSDTTDKATDHTIALTGLKGNTMYHIQARGFSLPKVIGKSADVTFITKASKIAGTVTDRKKDSFTVAWTTEEPTSSIVEYKNAKTGITERKTDDALRTSHSMQIANLPSGTTYEVNISGQTEKGNIAEAGSALSVTTSRDVTPPTITGFKVDNALVPGRTDRIQTIVSWTTDEPGNSTVYYEEGAGTAGDTKELANKNEELTSYVTAHSVILPSLRPGTIYRLKVASSDDSGNTGTFGPRTVITPQQAVSITDIIFKNFQDSFQFLKKI